MKKFFNGLNIFALTAVLSGGVVRAQDPMTLESLKQTKKECMDEYKDNKVCHEQTMKKCEEKNSKEDCTKMMKQIHKEMEKEKKHKKS